MDNFNNNMLMLLPAMRKVTFPDSIKFTKFHEIVQNFSTKKTFKKVTKHGKMCGRRHRFLLTEVLKAGEKEEQSDARYA